MKIKSLLFSILTIVLFSCESDSNNNQESEETLELQPSNNKETSNTKGYSNEKDTEVSKDQLIIHGNDIWVRDESATGKVVMKLNDGDRCAVLEQGFMELIRGDADYWYKIKFNGQEGWVFGAQTSYKNKEAPIVGSSRPVLWKNFEKNTKNWVTQENMSATKDEGHYKYNGLNTNEFEVFWEGEGPSSDHYTLQQSMAEQLCIISKTARVEGAMGFKNQWETFVGVNIGGEYIMHANGFDGKVMKVMPLNPDEFVMFTYQDSGKEIVMTHESYYTIYYINVANHSMRKIGTDLGKVSRDGQTYTAKNGLAVQSSYIEYLKDETSFTLNEERLKEVAKDSQISYTLYDTLQTHYVWNAKKKKYLKE